MLRVVFLCLLFIPFWSISQTKTECKCEENAVAPKGMSPSLADLNCNGINESILTLDEKKLKGLFYTSDITSTNSCSFNVLTYRKIILNYPKSEGLKLILNPCIVKSSSFPVEIEYEHKINQWFKDADYEKFSKKPRDYYRMLAYMCDFNDGKYIEFMKVARELISGYGASTDKFIADVKKNHPELHFSKNEYKGEFDFLNDFTQAIAGCQKCESKLPTEWVYDNYVKKHENPKDSMEVTKEIIQDFQVLFIAIGPFNLDNFNRAIFPQVTSQVMPNKSAFEIPVNILRRWNSEKQSPVLDTKGEKIPTQIIFDIKSIRYDPRQTFQFIGIKKTCFPLSEISGTGLLFKSDTIMPISNMERNLHDDFYGIDEDLLLFIQYKDEQNARFLYFPKGELTIPIKSIDGKNSKIVSNSSAVLLNGKVITGKISMKVKKVKGGFEYIMGDNKITFSEAALKQSLSKNKNVIFEIKINPIKKMDNEANNDTEIIILFKMITD